MTAEQDRPISKQLVVRECDGCERERLTARSTDGSDLCSVCMRAVPVDERPPVAKGLPEKSRETDANSTDPEENVETDPEQPEAKPWSETYTCRNALRDELAYRGEWASTTDLADATGYSVYHVRDVLREDDRFVSRNAGGPRATEWALRAASAHETALDAVPAPGEPWDADALRRARKAARLTQTELAERAGVSQPAISKWERGETEPDESGRDALRVALKRAETDT